jgi:hypothetical protein
VSTLERALLHASSLAAAVTGFAYFWMKYLLKGSDPFSVVHHPWQPGILAWHVLVVPLLVFALGLIAKDHVLEKLLDRRPHPSRRSGIVTMALAAPMILSGYLVQVLTAPSPHRLVAWSHIVAGVVFSAGYVAHLFLGVPGRRSAVKRGRGQPRRPPRAPVHPRLDRPGGLGLESNTRPRSDAPMERAPEGPERGRA